MQERIKQDNEYLKQLRQIDNEKKRYIKELKGFDNSEGLEGKSLTQSDGYKKWRKETNVEYKKKVDSLKEILDEQYLEEKKQILDNYLIFMAIAEDISYDATGRPTQNNELDDIGKELTRFIEAIEEENA